MFSIEIRLKYESKSDDKLSSTWSSNILREWGISEGLINADYRDRLEWRFYNKEVDISAKEFLKLVGDTEDMARRLMHIRYPVLRVMEGDCLSAFVKEFYEKGYDKILTSVTLSLQDQS